MIRVIMGAKGSGKTKRLIDMANDLVKEARGDVVYVDDDQRYMYDLRHEIRFIETSEYKKNKAYGPEWLYGFLGGVLSANFDISAIFIDAFIRHSGGELFALEDFFAKLRALSDNSGAELILSVGASEENVPEFIKQYAI